MPDKISSSTHIIIPKPNKKFDFGTAMHACKCENPKCNFLLDWKPTDPGVYEANCCGMKYEMYCETVSFGPTIHTDDSPREINRRRIAYSVPNSKKNDGNEEPNDD